MKRAKKSKKSIIRLRPSLFWDVDPKTIDLDRHAQYVIERVLDFGNDREARWLCRYYSNRKMRNVVKKSRVLHPKSRSLWGLITGLKKEDYERPISKTGPWIF